jgi:hypothetical protein
VKQFPQPQKSAYPPASYIRVVVCLTLGGSVEKGRKDHPGMLGEKGLIVFGALLGMQCVTEP